MEFACWKLKHSVLPKVVKWVLVVKAAAAGDCVLKATSTLKLFSEGLSNCCSIFSWCIASYGEPATPYKLGSNTDSPKYWRANVLIEYFNSCTLVASVVSVHPYTWTVLSHPAYNLHTQCQHRIGCCCSHWIGKRFCTTRMAALYTVTMSFPCWHQQKSSDNNKCDTHHIKTSTFKLQ